MDSEFDQSVVESSDAEKMSDAGDNLNIKLL